VKQPGFSRASIFLASTSFHYRQAEEVAHRPQAVGEASSHGRGASAITAAQARNALPQGFVFSGEMIIQSPPLHMEGEVSLPKNTSVR